jgi:SH3-like domain-containing protein
LAIARLIAGATLSLAAAASLAQDFKTVGSAPVILYDLPSIKGAKLFVAPRGMPLEVLLTYGEWVKVRDVNGDLAWTQARGLSNKRQVVARMSGLKVRASPEDGASVGFIAEKGTFLEVIEAITEGWIKVRLQDGESGYLRSADIWGN